MKSATLKMNPPNAKAVHSDLASFLRPQDGAFSQFYHALAMLFASKQIPPESIAARLVMEAMSRLRQLDYLHAQTTVAEDIVGRLVGRTPWSRAIAKSTQEAMFRSQLYAEAFYLFAFRFVDITRDVNEELYSKAEICPEPKGVRDVRNQLIIHPTDRKGQHVLNRSFDVSMADGRGVVLKSQRLPGERAEPVDAGFRANTAEFQSFIQRWIAEIGSRLGVFKEP